MVILGIETSCDETAAAVVSDGTRIHSNVVYSQIARHQPFGGVVPEIASRAHVEYLPGVIEQALAQADTAWPEIDALAVTRGPGLASSLLVGVTAAKALALRLNKPLWPVNHLEAHLYSLFLAPGSPPPEDLCPLLVLLVTGGHTALVRVDQVGRYRLLGQTMDDAAGEALDKGAKLMQLGYPGGPAIERAAVGGRREAIPFPRGLARGPGRVHGLERAHCFSFSGVKTALLYYLRQHPDALRGDGLKDVAASYQEAVFASLLDRAQQAVDRERVSVLGCVGGVARNQRLRELLGDLAARRGMRLVLAPPELCTDNAAMVAALAGSSARMHLVSPLDLDVDPNLPLGSS